MASQHLMLTRTGEIRGQVFPLFPSHHFKNYLNHHDGIGSQVVRQDHHHLSTPRAFVIISSLIVLVIWGVKSIIVTSVIKRGAKLDLKKSKIIISQISLQDLLHGLETSWWNNSASVKSHKKGKRTHDFQLVHGLFQCKSAQNSSI